MGKRNTVSYCDLLLDTGELVRIEYPDWCEDEFYESLEACMKRRDWFCSGQWDGCHMTYIGTSIQRVAMSRVIGVL